MGRSLKLKDYIIGRITLMRTKVETPGLQFVHQGYQIQWQMTILLQALVMKSLELPVPAVSRIKVSTGSNLPTSSDFSPAILEIM